MAADMTGRAYLPPSDEGGGFCEAKDGGRDMCQRTCYLQLNQNPFLPQGVIAPLGDPTRYFFLI